MTNRKIRNKIIQWQRCGLVHPLTCGLSSSHQMLVPAEKDGKVILKCPTCGYEQKNIPDIVLKLDLSKKTRKALLGI